MVFIYIYIAIYNHISKIVTFINIVITGVKNGSPGMIPVAFERKFDEKKDEIPPSIYRPHIADFFSILGMAGLTKKHKNCHKYDHMGSPMDRIWHVP